MNRISAALRQVKPLNLLLVILGSLIQALGLSNIHAYANVTEGGVLGLMLLLNHWTGMSTSIAALLLNGLCFLLGWRVLGGVFLVYTAAASLSASLFLALLEPFAPMWPALISHPLIASVAGAAFIGVGAGLAVRAGGAPSGDDALAMALSRLAHVRIERIYLLSDLVVLALSLTYIPVRRIAYSLLTVVLSGQIIGLMQRIPLRKRPGPPDDRS